MTAPLIGRCGAKGCKAAARLVPDTTKVHRDYRYGPRDVIEYAVAAFSVPGFPAGDPRAIVTTADYTNPRNGYSGAPWCVEHQRPLRWSVVRGTVVDDIRCDARCESAKGPNCDCSCGGRNHGGSWG